MSIFKIKTAAFQALKKRFYSSTFFILFKSFFRFFIGCKDEVFTARQQHSDNINRLTINFSQSFVALTALMMVAWRQAEYWENSATLFERSIVVTENNTAAHLNLGYVLAEKGKYNEAISHYREVIRIAPDHLKAHNYLGLALAKVGKIEEAFSHYRYGLNRSPGKVDVINNLAYALSQKGSAHEAIKHYNFSLRLRRDQADVHNDLGVLLARVGRVGDAVINFEKTLAIQPGHANVCHNIQSLQMPGHGRKD